MLPLYSFFRMSLFLIITLGLLGGVGGFWGVVFFWGFGCRISVYFFVSRLFRGG